MSVKTAAIEVLKKAQSPLHAKMMLFFISLCRYNMAHDFPD